MLQIQWSDQTAIVSLRLTVQQSIGRSAFKHFSDHFFCFCRSYSHRLSERFCQSNFTFVLVLLYYSLSWPMESQTKANRAFCSHAFSCALRRLHVFPLSSDWSIAPFRSAVIGQNDYLVLVLQQSIENCSILPAVKSDLSLVPKLLEAGCISLEKRSFLSCYFSLI